LVQTDVDSSFYAYDQQQKSRIQQLIEIADLQLLPLPEARLKLERV